MSETVESCKYDIKHYKSTNFKMNENAESLTVSSKACHHVNLVKLQKNKTDNTITLDILTSAKCQKKRRDHASKETRRNIFRFSFLNQLTASVASFEVSAKSNSIRLIQIFSLFCIILANVTKILAYASSKNFFKFPIVLQ